MEEKDPKFRRDEVQLVVFQLGKERFGLDIMCVKEIIKLPPITRLPHAPAFVDGVMNLRGEVIPVINLRKRLQMGDRPVTTRDTRIIVGELDHVRVGLTVDSVTEVLRLDASCIVPLPDEVSGVWTAFIAGVGKVGQHLLLVLNLEELVRFGDDTPQSAEQEQDLRQVLEAVAAS